ncbi:hypothetical protein ACFOEQ_19090 [Chryseobacterium arachidis]
MREWIPYGNVDADIGVQTVGEWDDEVTFTESYYNPLEIVTFSQYMDHDDIETGDVLENCIISNVPALFVKHASDLKEWQKVHQMIRIGTDVLMILGSIATIESGASGMILYAAVADLGLATADLTIQGGLKQNLERTTEGREFLEEWDNFYNIATFATAGPVIVKAIEKKIPQIMEKAVPIFHSFKLQALPAEKFSNILLKSVYSLNIKGFCKSGLQLVRYRKCAVEFGQLYKGAFRLQDAGLLFIKNIKGDVSTIYKGIVLKSGSKEEVGNFINNILNKVRGRKKIEVYLDKLIKTLRETEDYSSIFAKTVSSVEDGVTKIIKDFEKEIIAKKITKEDGLLVNNARNIKQRHVGEKFPDYIVWDNIPSTYFKGSKITHFHPNGSGLSLADIWMFITCELLEIRAFGPTGTVYSMKNLGLPDKVVEELWDMIQMQEVLGASLNEGKAFKQLWKKMEPYVEYSKYVNK